MEALADTLQSDLGRYRLSWVLGFVRQPAAVADFQDRADEVVIVEDRIGSRSRRAHFAHCELRHIEETPVRHLGSGDNRRSLGFQD